jgi:hypothetical protein
MSVEIVSADDVRTRLGLPANSYEADDAIESALVAAENFVYGRLETPLQYATGIVDSFLLTANVFPMNLNTYMRMRLSQAFVEADTVSVASGDTLELVVAVPSTDYVVDHAKGIIQIKEDYVGKFITVTYNAGMKTADVAPPWLAEAILAYVPGVLNTMQITNREEGEEAATIKQAEELVAGIIAPNMRGRAFHYRPMFNAY